MMMMMMTTTTTKMLMTMDKFYLDNRGGGGLGKQTILFQGLKTVSFAPFSRHDYHYILPITINLILNCQILLLLFIGGIICFNVRDGQLDDYREKIKELERTARWEVISKNAVSFFETEEMPRETYAFLFRVLGK